jgi:hypothetical protein
MIEDKAVFKSLKPGLVTLMHLLFWNCVLHANRNLGMAMTQVKHSGGGMLRHLVTAPRALRSVL